MLFRFQWQKERLVHWPGPGFTSTSPQGIIKSLNALDISKLIQENVWRETQKSCPSLMTSFVSRKKLFVQRKKKGPKIKSLLLENFLNTINNRRNNNILYKVKSQHFVLWNTADCWVVFTNNPITAGQVFILTGMFKM